MSGARLILSSRSLIGAWGAPPSRADAPRPLLSLVWPILAGGDFMRWRDKIASELARLA